MILNKWGDCSYLKLKNEKIELEKSNNITYISKVLYKMEKMKTLKICFSKYIVIFITKEHLLKRFDQQKNHW